jgi:hypothetical protein
MLMGMQNVKTRSLAIRENSLEGEKDVSMTRIKRRFKSKFRLFQRQYSNFQGQFAYRLE